MITSLEELSPAARVAAQNYLDSVAATLAEESRESVVAELRSYLLERLRADAAEADVLAVVGQAGPVSQWPSSEPMAERARRALLDGLRLRGLGARIAATWWNPADERVLVRRAFGWGWDLNFGAVAVRLGLIEPDAEAEPFTSTPDGAFRVAALVPLSLAAATVVHYAVRGRSLPARLPAHWRPDGSPDRWTTRTRAATADLAATVVPAAVAGWAALSSRSRPTRAGVIAAASAIASVGAVTTLVRSLGDARRPWVGLLTMGALTGSVGSVLVGMARAGRAAEIRRDLRQE